MTDLRVIKYITYPYYILWNVHVLSCQGNTMHTSWFYRSNDCKYIRMPARMRMGCIASYSICLHVWCDIASFSVCLHVWCDIASFSVCLHACVHGVTCPDSACIMSYIFRERVCIMPQCPLMYICTYDLYSIFKK